MDSPRQGSGKPSTIAAKIVAALLPSGVVLAVYALLSVWYFSPIPDLHHAYAGVGADPLSFIWAINYWPWALRHGVNPFITNSIWYPEGINLTWVTSVPTVALLMLPVTLLWDAAISWNVIALAAPVVAAWTTFLLVRYITRDFCASLVGGYIFGFSTYELAHLLGHLNLYLDFVPPLLVLVALLRLQARIGATGFIASVAALLLLQIGVSTEILATTGVFSAMAWLVFVPFADAAGRRRLWLLARESAIASAVTALLAAPFLYYVVTGAQTLPDVINPPQQYSIDLFNFFVPTPVTAFGGHVFASVAARFPGNFAESSGYLGLPLILALVAGLRSPMSHRLPLGIVMLLLAICSLGPALWVNGVQTGIWLPWRIAVHLPVIRHALPGRFTMFLFLAIAVVLARWLAEQRPAQVRAARYALVLLGCLCLLPAPIPWSQLPTHPFFAADAIAGELPQGDNVIVLPFGPTGAGMLWQVQSGMYFTQTGGYFGPPPRAFEADADLIDTLSTGTPRDSFANDITAFVAAHQVRDVLAAPGTPQSLLDNLAALQWPARAVGDVRIFHVPAEDELHYVDIRGEYRRCNDDRCPMGRRITVTTHNRAARISFEVKGSPFALHVDINGSVATSTVGAGSVVAFDLPASTRMLVEAEQTFAPGPAIHDADRRAVGVLVSLQINKPP
jgi:hypothetical protein